MNISIIGTGRLGSALGARLAYLGHSVLFSGGSPEAVASVVATLPGARHGTNAEAAEFGDIVVLAVPFGAIATAIEQTEGRLADTVLWSCVNALTPDTSGLAVGFDNSGAEEVAKLARGARVVAALPPFAQLLAPDGPILVGGQKPTVFACGDDEQAKLEVLALIGELGLAGVDAGPLVTARLVEPAMMLVVGLAYRGAEPRLLALNLMES